jgi:hypothetical protein
VGLGRSPLQSIYDAKGVVAELDRVPEPWATSLPNVIRRGTDGLPDRAG